MRLSSDRKTLAIKSTSQPRVNYMTIATFSQTARMMGYRSRSTLYRLKRDGLLSDYEYPTLDKCASP